MRAGIRGPKHTARVDRLCRHSGLLHLGIALLELHVSLGSSLAAQTNAREPPLHRILDGEKRGGGPQSKLERRKDSGGPGGAADGTAAKEQLVEEDGESDEASKVEQDVHRLQGENSPRVVDYGGHIVSFTWNRSAHGKDHSLLAINLGASSRYAMERREKTGTKTRKLI